MYPARLWDLHLSTYKSPEEFWDMRHHNPMLQKRKLKLDNLHKVTWLASYEARLKLRKSSSEPRLLPSCLSTFPSNSQDSLTSLLPSAFHNRHTQMLWKCDKAICIFDVPPFMKRPSKMHYLNWLKVWTLESGRLESRPGSTIQVIINVKALFQPPHLANGDNSTNV